MSQIKHPARGGANRAVSVFNRQKENNRNRRAAQCFLCRFYAEICLKTGRMRHLCRLNGEKDPNVGMAGCIFEQGAQGDFGGLTSLQSESSLEVPKVERQSDSLLHAPHGENSGFFDLKSHFHAGNRHEYKLADKRPVSVTTGGLSTTGEHLSAFCI